MPQPSISGSAPSSAARVVIRIGRKRSRQAWWIASRGGLPSSRSASSAKSIIMIAFFFTMPISRMMPMMPMMPRSLPGDHQRQQRADAGRGQGREDGDRVDEALVEHAQHDVDVDDRRQDQQQLVASEAWKAQRRALEAGRDRWPACRCRASRLLDRVHRRAERDARREVERDGGRRELAEVVDQQRRRAARCTVAMADSGTCPPPRSTAGRSRRATRGECCSVGSASRITRYWFDWVKMVEMMRWPKAS